jgi:hypothetical protein
MGIKGKVWIVMMRPNQQKEDWINKLRDAWHREYYRPLPAAFDLVVKNQPNAVKVYCTDETLEKILDLNAEI